MRLLFAAAGVSVLCAVSFSAQQPVATTPSRVDFVRDVQPIFEPDGAATGRWRLVTTSVSGERRVCNRAGAGLAGRERRDDGSGSAVSTGRRIPHENPAGRRLVVRTVAGDRDSTAARRGIPARQASVHFRGGDELGHAGAGAGAPAQEERDVTSASTRSITSSTGTPVVSISVASAAIINGDAARVESLLSRSARAVATSAS